MAYNCFSNIHFIYISGAIIYKNQNKINSENSEVSKFSKNKYCNSKILSEKKLLLRKKRGLMLTIFRATSIYGWGLNKFKIISLNEHSANVTIK